MKKRAKKKLIAFTVLLVAVVIGLILNFYFNFPSTIVEKYHKASEEKILKTEKEPWITVFVHGSFGSTLGFLNAYNVLSDDVDGTYYKKLVHRLRKDPFFYRNQPFLEKGLVWVAPTFNLEKRGGKKYAAYPLTKAYQKVTDYVKPDKEKNYFYTYGWSGLLSQSRRCYEAIRFYNELSEKLAKYNKKGIYPKVRVLTHSHGGNLLAYVAAIDEVLRHEGDEEFESCSFGDRKDALVRVCKMLKTLPTKARKKVLNKTDLKKKKSQKRWDYKPEGSTLEIDELILWAMPVQTETDNLFSSPVFKTCYHFYSGDDLVQRVDWISTKDDYSNRRFDSDRLQAFGDEKNRFVQSRIMVGRDFGDKNGNKVVPGDEKEKESFWSILFSGGALVSPTSQDPTHKELWFFTWHYDNSGEREFILAPFPVAVFTPLLVKLLNENKDVWDADINLVDNNKHIDFCLLGHESNSCKSKFCLKKKFIQSMSEKVDPWRYGYVESNNLFDSLRKIAVGA